MKKFLALILALTMSLSLAACGGGDAEKPAPSADPTPAPSLEVDLTKDVMSFSAGELAGKDNLVTINGTAVPTNRLLYWLAFSCMSFQQNYMPYGLNLVDYAKNILADSVTMAANYVILEQKALELGCNLTDEQNAEIEATIAKDKEDFPQRLELNGLTEEDLRFMLSMGYYYDNVLAAVTEAPTEEELNNYVYHAKHILIATAVAGEDGKPVLSTQQPALNEDGTPFTGTVEEYNTAAKAKAEDLLAQIRAAENTEETFDKLMNQYSQDGRDTEGNLGAPDGYDAVRGYMVPEFESASLALKIGELSDLVKSDFGYHIILRGEVKNMETYAAQYRQDEMDDLVTAWVKEATVEQDEALATLDVPDFFVRYISWQKTYLDELKATEG